jgi:hypothetical protein
VLLNNSTNHRLWVVAEHAMRWQAMGWDRERAVPFFDFIQQSAPR